MWTFVSRDFALSVIVVSATLVGFAAMFVSLGCGDRSELLSDKPKAPNILIVTIDTLRADHLATYGYFRRTSPTIDALAAESIVFDRCI